MASARYAFLMSSVEAVGETPRILYGFSNECLLQGARFYQFTGDYVQLSLILPDIWRRSGLIVRLRSEGRAYDVGNAEDGKRSRARLL